MNIQWTQDAVSVAGTVIVIGLAYLAKQKGWIGAAARKAERVIDPAVQVVEDVTNGAKSAVVIHDVQSALAATTKQAQDALVQSLVQRYAAAAKSDIGALTSTQMGGLVSYVYDQIPPSWRSVVTKSVIGEASTAAQKEVDFLVADVGFQAVQKASAVIHSADKPVA